MDDLNRIIGKRLQEVRRIYNNGFRCSVEQLASEISETPANIRNYECGKAGIPNRVLVALYRNGINPIYILTGDGTPYAPNDEGKALESRSRENRHANVDAVYRLAKPQHPVPQQTVAAGAIAEEIARNRDKKR